MPKSRGVSRWKDALLIRFIALSFLVVLVGVGSQVLVNSLSASAKMLSVEVTTYHAEGRMADGNWANTGACADAKGQFPYGTIVALYRSDGTFVRQCVIEDTQPGLKKGQIALAMPDGSTELNHWSKQQLSLQILYWGSNKTLSSDPAINSPASQHLSTLHSPFEKIHNRSHKLTATCSTTSHSKIHGC